MGMDSHDAFRTSGQERVERDWVKVEAMKFWQYQRKNKRNKQGVKQTMVALIGTTSGVGTTSAAISLGVFLSHYCHYRVAYVEHNSNMHLNSIRKAAGIIDTNEYFSISRVDYFTSCLDEVWQLLREKEYDYVIVDYGVYDPNRISQYAQCEYRFVMGSLCEWKREFYLELIQNSRFIRKDTVYLATLGRRYDINSFYKDYNVYLKSVPCIYDPFLLDNAVTCFWKQFSL